MGRVYDSVMASEEDRRLGHYRRELLGQVHGEVLEVGAGTGANVPYYPDTVSRLVLAEPDVHMRQRLQRKHPDLEVSSAALGDLPFADESFDVVVCTLVLCTVADPVQALRDLRRVLRPEGRLVFLEHVVATTKGLQRAQRLSEPLWRLVAGGCHLTRDTGESIERAGFELEWIERDDQGMQFPLTRTLIRGVAHRRSVG